MGFGLIKAAAGGVLFLAASAVSASAGAPAPAPLAIEHPIYLSVWLETPVDRPAAQVWARVGKYCDLAEWLRASCTITSGKDGELGAVRSLGIGGGGNTIDEILVGKTDMSYTYTQPVRVGQPYILYHGTLEVKPVTATTSKIIYSLVWDGSTLADDAARERNKTQRSTTFKNASLNMKALAEGRPMPPAAPPAGPAPAAPPAR